MAAQGRATHGDRVEGGQTVREWSRQVSALNLDLPALHDPEDALTEEVRASVIESVDVWVTPKQARSGLLCEVLHRASTLARTLLRDEGDGIWQ